MTLNTTRSADVLSGRHLVSMTFCQDGRTALDVLSGPPWTFCQDGFMLDVLSGRHFVSSRMASLGRFVRTPSVLQLLGTNGYFWILLGTNRYFWVLLGTFGNFWVLTGTYGYF